ncbi:MAG: AMP-binding protein, partial [Arenibacter algicola]|nr:AMP-binding protein [Arenibacter algicola]
MSDNQIFPVPSDVAEQAWADNAKYLEMYKASVDDPEGFWGEHGKRLDWIKPYTQVKDINYDRPGVSIKWFYDGTLNASVNCIDRHLKDRADQTAIIWEGDDPSVDKKISYQDLHDEVCKMANALKARGVKKGSVVTIYM